VSARRSPPVPRGPEEDEPGDPESVARLLCLRQLEARARTRAELAAYLAGKGIEDAPATRVLDRFAELGLIDDRALAMQFVSTRHEAQGLARRALGQKLRQRGVDAEIMDQALGQIGLEDETERARALVARKLRSTAGLDPAVQARRLVSMLARKGYSSGVAYRVVREQIALVELENAVD
jgi:regulatory protein